MAFNIRKRGKLTYYYHGEKPGAVGPCYGSAAGR